MLYTDNVMQIYIYTHSYINRFIHYYVYNSLKVIEYNNTYYAQIWIYTYSIYIYINAYVVE
jgi:hypothetical protein